MSRLHTCGCGTVARLPNGNTLLAATEAGRAIEATPGHEVVWEFRTPHRTGEHRELMAALFSLTRVPTNLELGWTRGDRAFARASR